jgi:hypothetical protein
MQRYDISHFHVETRLDHLYAVFSSRFYHADLEKCYMFAGMFPNINCCDNFCQR